MKDSLDGAFDVSDYMIYSNGFIVIPVPITEPSLGGIGGALVPLFIKKRQPAIDTIDGKPRLRRVNPDMTGAIGMYTANNSWVAGAFRMGTFAKPGITYRVLAAYADINMDFYHNIPKLGEQKFQFNFKTIPFYVQALKQFRNPLWSAGLRYMYLDTKVSLAGDSLPAFASGKQRNSVVSRVGGILQYDGRNNIFTADKGMYSQLDFYWSSTALGSDYNDWRINYSFIDYVPIVPTLIAGFRFDGQQAIGETPFYLLPYVNLRGVPSQRYQGDATLVSEVETRWDVYYRWSLVFYGGTGVAFDHWDNMFEHPLVYNYGTGIRYFLARKFGLRMGVDVARGPEQWAFYVVFGSSWFR